MTGGKPSKESRAGATGAEADAKARSKRCPICGKPAVSRYRPFCSSRCADVDLGRWIKGTYHIPTEEAPSEETGEGQESRDRGFDPGGDEF